MHMTELLSNTQREVPAEAHTYGHQLLLKGGYIQQHANRAFSLLPLGLRALTKIENLIYAELKELKGQEIRLPTRVRTGSPRLSHTNQAQNMPPHEEEKSISQVIHRQLRSYRQLPSLIYHSQIEVTNGYFRVGTLRPQEVTLIISYSLDRDKAGLNHHYDTLLQAYHRALHTCGLHPTLVPDAGSPQTQELLLEVPSGHLPLLRCNRCGYVAHQQLARFRRTELPSEEPQPLKKVATPNCKTIDDLATYLDIPTTKTAKAVFAVGQVEGQDRLIFAVVRGDLAVSEAKLRNAVRAESLRPATEAEIRAIGAEPGYGSPIGVHGNVTIVLDESISTSHNLVAGANEPGYHFLNVNAGRDFKPDLIGDIALAQTGAPCPECGAPLLPGSAVPIGSFAKLNPHSYTLPDTTFVDENGKEHSLWIGVYRLSPEQILGAIAETYNDAYGLIWPVTVAPYPIHLITLGPEASEARRTADDLYVTLTNAGLEVLYDDRDRSPGVKFNDADLIGLPLRITVARRGLAQGCAEFKLRSQHTRWMVPLTQVVEAAQEKLASLHANITAGHTAQSLPAHGPSLLSKA